MNESVCWRFRQGSSEMAHVVLAGLISMSIVSWQVSGEGAGPRQSHWLHVSCLTGTTGFTGPLSP